MEGGDQVVVNPLSLPLQMETTHRCETRFGYWFSSFYWRDRLSPELERDGYWLYRNCVSGKCSWMSFRKDQLSQEWGW